MLQYQLYGFATNKIVMNTKKTRNKNLINGCMFPQEKLNKALALSFSK